MSEETTKPAQECCDTREKEVCCGPSAKAGCCEDGDDCRC